MSQIHPASCAVASVCDAMGLSGATGTCTATKASGPLGQADGSPEAERLTTVYRNRVSA